MNKKENAYKIIRFDNPERITTGIPLYYISYLGCNHEGFNGKCVHDFSVGSRWKDIWGTIWLKELEGVMGIPRGYPLAEPTKMNDFTWLDPDDERIISKIYKEGDKFQKEDKKDVFLTGHHRDTLWEKAYMLVGMENIMTYFYSEPIFVKKVLHRIMDFQLGIARHYIQNGVELVLLGDDLGGQDGLLLSPQIINEFLMPEYKRLFKFYKNKDVLIDFHSCGKIDKIIDVFIDLGVDVLNPVQATANDLDKLRQKTQGKIALRGGVNSRVIMEGPVEKIREEVKKRLVQLGKNGGYFCAQDQGLPFPQEHLDVLHKTVEKEGKYPLRKSILIEC